MKRILLLLSIMVSLSANAQSTQSNISCAPSVGKLEGELFGGVALPLGHAKYGTKKAGWSAGAELRYNLPVYPLDVGVQFTHSTTKASMLDYNLNTILATTDWNFARGSMFNPFAGLGMGVAISDREYDKTQFAVKPRIGVEFNDCLRLTASAQFSKMYFHNMQLSLGFVIGGRRHTDMAQESIKKEETIFKLKNDKPIVEQTPMTEAERRHNFLIEKQRQYHRRSVTYGVLGGVSLGSGLVLTTLGIVTLIDNPYGDPSQALGGAMVTAGGGLLMLGSLPLIIASHHQSVKGAKISATITALNTPHTATAPGLGLTLNF